MTTAISSVQKIIFKLRYAFFFTFLLIISNGVTDIINRQSIFVSIYRIYLKLYTNQQKKIFDIPIYYVDRII